MHRQYGIARDDAELIASVESRQVLGAGNDAGWRNTRDQFLDFFVRESIVQRRIGDAGVGGGEDRDRRRRTIHIEQRKMSHTGVAYVPRQNPGRHAQFAVAEPIVAPLQCRALRKAVGGHVQNHRNIHDGVRRSIG